MVGDLYKGYMKDYATYEKIYKYFKGDTDAIVNYTATDRSNLKVNTNYIKKFVKEETSYSVGNKITYASKSGDELVNESIDMVTENFKENHDVTTFMYMVLFGIAYEIYFIDKWDNLQVKPIKPTNGYHIEDDEGNILEFIHVYNKVEYRNGEEVLTEYVDHYDAKEIKVYINNNGTFELQDTISHYFGECPVGVAPLSEELYNDTLYKDIKGLQDALETNLSDITNEISDFRNAYLIMTGLEIDEESAAGMKRLGIIQNPEADGKIEWLIKNINDGFIQNTLDVLEDKIYQLSSHINANDTQAMSNASGVALKSRLITLTQRCYINQNSFKELLKTRIRIIFTFLRVANNVSLDWKDVDIRFTPLIPSDDSAIADLIQKLDGKLSAQTGLSLLSFVEDGKREHELAQEELLENSAMNDYMDTTETDTTQEEDNVDETE